MAKRKPSKNGKATGGEAGKAAANGSPRPSPLTGVPPPVEYQFSSTRQPDPSRRKGPAVAHCKIADAIQAASGKLCKERYTPRFLRMVEDALGMKIDEMTVAEAMAATAEVRALMGSERMWENVADRNEGKVATKVSLERDVAEVTREEIDRLVRVRSDGPGPADRSG